MKTKNHELSTEQKQLARKIISDPVLFAERIFGAQLWEKQIEILRSIQKNRRTAVRACHSSGKTFVMAIAALWWLARYADGIVLTTSSTFRQVKTQLWPEIHRLIGQAKIHYPALG